MSTQMYMGDENHSPAGALTLVHWSTGDTGDATREVQEYAQTFQTRINQLSTTDHFYPVTIPITVYSNRWLCPKGGWRKERGSVTLCNVHNRNKRRFKKWHHRWLENEPPAAKVQFYFCHSTDMSRDNRSTQHVKHCSNIKSARLLIIQAQGLICTVSDMLKATHSQKIMTSFVNKSERFRLKHILYRYKDTNNLFWNICR